MENNLFLTVYKVCVIRKIYSKSVLCRNNGVENVYLQAQRTYQVKKNFKENYKTIFIFPFEVKINAYRLYMLKVVVYSHNHHTVEHKKKGKIAKYIIWSTTTIQREWTQRNSLCDFIFTTHNLLFFCAEKIKKKTISYRRLYACNENNMRIK